MLSRTRARSVRTISKTLPSRSSTKWNPCLLRRHPRKSLRVEINTIMKTRNSNYQRKINRLTKPLAIENSDKISLPRLMRITNLQCWLRKTTWMSREPTSTPCSPSKSPQLINKIWSLLKKKISRSNSKSGLIWVLSIVLRQQESKRDKTCLNLVIESTAQA